MERCAPDQRISVARVGPLVDQGWRDDVEDRLGRRIAEPDVAAPCLVCDPVILADGIVRRDQRPQEAQRRFAIGLEPINDSYNAASFVARCVLLAEKDAELPVDKRKVLVKKYADQAMSLLKQAVTNGYKDADHMKKDDDLAPLRSRKDFQDLIAELEKRLGTRQERSCERPATKGSLVGGLCQLQA